MVSFICISYFRSCFAYKHDCVYILHLKTREIENGMIKTSASARELYL